MNIKSIAGAARRRRYRVHVSAKRLERRDCSRDASGELQLILTAPGEDGRIYRLELSGEDARRLHDDLAPFLELSRLARAPAE